MKLLATIKPRSKSGTVVVRDDEGKEYVFAPDEDGVLVCDIPSDALVVKLLMLDNGGRFEPADADDHERAEQLLLAAGHDAAADDDGDDADGDDEPVDPNALPLEANTPPIARAKPKKRTSRG